MARPKKVIPWDKVEELCAIMCTGEEIARIISVDYDTLATAIKREHGLSFSDYYKKHSATGVASLRRRQFKSAVEDGNVTMLIWLGKQYLGQKDTQFQDAAIDEKFTAIMRSLGEKMV